MVIVGDHRFSIRSILEKISKKRNILLPGCGVWGGVVGGVVGGIAGGLEMKHWVGWYSPGNPLESLINEIYHGWGHPPTLKEGGYQTYSESCAGSETDINHIIR